MSASGRLFSSCRGAGDKHFLPDVKVERGSAGDIPLASVSNTQTNIQTVKQRPWLSVRKSRCEVLCGAFGPYRTATTGAYHVKPGYGYARRDGREDRYRVRDRFDEQHVCGRVMIYLNVVE